MRAISALLLTALLALLPLNAGLGDADTEYSKEFDAWRRKQKMTANQLSHHQINNGRREGRDNKRSTTVLCVKLLLEANGVVIFTNI